MLKKKVMKLVQEVRQVATNRASKASAGFVGELTVLWIIPVLCPATALALQASSTTSVLRTGSVLRCRVKRLLKSRLFSGVTLSANFVSTLTRTCLKRRTKFTNWWTSKLQQTRKISLSWSRQPSKKIQVAQFTLWLSLMSRASLQWVGVTKAKLESMTSQCRARTPSSSTAKTTVSTCQTTSPSSALLSS